MKAMRELALLSLAFLCMPMAAQDKVEATVQADLVSKYLWRGQELGHISIQPKASVSWKGLSLTALGKAMEKQAYTIIPAGMGKELSACPFQLDDYTRFASELDTIIDTLKNKEK